ncbi:hypothetical protein B296_00053024 [Ensete ventricosum]|uniref:Uncharacterized protein n=1 Tax=Ensete ventricosum TaxID=4639 RepID=A0A426XCH9_ENSVE|nr:hypothetical protein B296_00053024 [Ensete ventricosum]
MGSRTSMVSRKNTTVINFTRSRVSIGFPAPSRKFKILAISNVLAHWKSYEYGYAKKCNDHKLCAKSSFVRFFEHCLRNLKYRPFPTY